ncbi:MAG TPA: Clp protease N-terminal domain-containing protein [Microlunatus sp.]
MSSRSRADGQGAPSVRRARSAEAGGGGPGQRLSLLRPGSRSSRHASWRGSARPKCHWSASRRSSRLPRLNGPPTIARTSNAFNRFTDLSRHSIVLAQEAARTHQHELIGTEHLLLGLLSEPRGVAYEVLVAHTGSEEDIRDVVDDAMPPAGETTLQGHIAFGADSSVAIEQALRASSDLGHDWVGTEHLLLGLIRTADSPAADSDEPRLHLEGLHDTVATAVTERLATLGR